MKFLFDQSAQALLGLDDLSLGTVSIPLLEHHESSLLAIERHPVSLVRKRRIQ